MFQWLVSGGIMEFEIKNHVRQSEVDTKNRMRPAIIIELMQEAAAQHCFSLGKDAWQMIEEDHRTWIISRMNMEIVKQIPMYTDIDVRTGRNEGKAATFPRSYDIRSNGEILAKGFGQWACVDVDNGSLVKFNDFYEGNSNFGLERIEMSLPDKFRVSPDLVFNKVSELEVTRHMTDVNGHVNNAKYVDPLWDALPLFDDYNVTGFSIYYKHECKLGETLDITMSEPERISANKVEIFQKVDVCGENRLQAKWILSKR